MAAMPTAAQQPDLILLLRTTAPALAPRWNEHALYVHKVQF